MRWYVGYLGNEGGMLGTWVMRVVCTQWVIAPQVITLMYAP